MTGGFCLARCVFARHSLRIPAEFRSDRHQAAQTLVGLVLVESVQVALQKMIRVGVSRLRQKSASAIMAVKPAEQVEDVISGSFSMRVARRK